MCCRSQLRLGKARAAEPIKVGLSIALTGAVAPNGKQILLALQIWRDDVNAKGGLLGRPVELVYYDDQSTPANVPGIYAKLIDIDKVDLLIGPYATNMIAAAMPTIMERKMTTIGMMGLAVNRQFHYPRYFSHAAHRTGGSPRVLQGIFRIGDGAKAQAGDGRDRRRRRRIRPRRVRWSAGERQGLWLESCV